MTLRLSYPWARSVWLLALLVVCVGCAPTRQTRSVDKSGFLGDYSKMTPGSGDQAQLRYEKPGVDWWKYDSVQIKSVELWGSKNFSKLSMEEEAALTGSLYHAFHDELGKDFKLVEDAGPKTIVMRLAITEAKGANGTMNAVTTAVPQLKLINTLGGMATDVAVFVGEAEIEMELTDGTTGERIFAGVDERVGTKTYKGMFSKWDDVDEAFKYWAELCDFS